MSRYLAPSPPERIALVRILVSAYAVTWLVVRLPHLLDVSAFVDDPRFDPIGPLWFLEQTVPVGIARSVVLATLVIGLASVAGWHWRWTGPVFGLLFLLVTTYRSSFGQVWHTENLVALHLLVLAFAPAADALSLDQRRAQHREVVPRSEHGWPLRLCTVVTVLAYVVSGLAKLRYGGTGWVTGDALHHHVAHDNLRKALLGDPWSPLGAFALRAAWIFPPLAAVSLLVEVGAPIALLGGRARTAWILAAWSFHVGVLALMAIPFPYQLTGVAYASMLPVERWFAGVGRWPRSWPTSRHRAASAALPRRRR